MKKRKIIMIIAAVILVATLVYLFAVRVGKDIKNALEQQALNTKLASDIYSDKLPVEYSHLFKSTDNISVERTDESRRRNAISELSYDKKYYVLVYKIDTIGNVPISKFIKSEKLLSSIAMAHENYVEYDNNSAFSINFKEIQKPKVSGIYFTSFGNHVQVIKKNDSLVYYYSPGLENFSIKYGQDDEEDIYGNIKDNVGFNKAPMEMLFLIKNKKLYFILLTVGKDGITLDSDLLYSLTTH